ncbi:MAG: GNAT family N-acetyltransferase, partial [Gammaproteobacteria bacterium]
MKIYTLEKIETPRLMIRPIQAGDEIELNQALHRSLSSVQRWMPWAKDPSLSATKDFVQRGVYIWHARTGDNFPMVVIHKADKKIIAASGYNEESVPIEAYYEIGYWIDADYQGQGLVTEFVNALTRYALE